MICRFCNEEEATTQVAGYACCEFCDPEQYEDLEEGEV